MPSPPARDLVGDRLVLRGWSSRGRALDRVSCGTTPLPGDDQRGGQAGEGAAEREARAAGCRASRT